MEPEEKQAIGFAVGGGLVLVLLNLIGVYVISSTQPTLTNALAIGQFIALFIIGKQLAKNGFGIARAGVGGGLTGIAAGVCSSIILVLLVRMGFIPPLLSEAGASAANMSEWWDEFLSGFLSSFLGNLILGFIIAFIAAAIGAAVEVFFSKGKEKTRTKKPKEQA